MRTKPSAPNALLPGARRLKGFFAFDAGGDRISVIGEEWGESLLDQATRVLSRRAHHLAYERPLSTLLRTFSTQLRWLARCEREGRSQQPLGRWISERKAELSSKLKR